MSKPLGRVVLHIGAMIATALAIVTSRKGRAAATLAEAWLAGLSEERYLQAAMMADAADEGLLLVRICDHEIVDTADLPGEVQSFLGRVRFLFGPRGGCTEVEGYTKYALTEVRPTVRTFHAAGRQMSFGIAGGISPAVVRRALGRMAGWLATAEAVVQTEFPSFDVLQSFQIFSLLEQGRRPGRDDHHGHDGRAGLEPDAIHFARLGQAFRVDPHRLAAQHRCFRPLAAQRLSSGCPSSGVAWQSAVMQSQRRAEQRARYPCDALLPVLIAQRTFTASTSGVEQGFAQALHAVGPRQLHASAAFERDLVKVVVDRVPTDEDAVLKNARLVWARVYGAPRLGRSAPRCDKGAQRAPRLGGHSEVGFLRARRSAVRGAAMIPTSPDGAAAVGSPLPLLLGGQLAELKFQEDKLLRRKFEAYEAGLLTSHEVSDDFRQQADAYLAKRRKTDSTNIRARERTLALSKGGAALPDDELCGMLAHIDDAAISVVPGPDDGYRRVALRQQLLAKGLVRTDDLTLARCFVVVDPTVLTVQTRWVASLVGGYVVTPAVLQAGARGAAVKYNVALKSNREVWVSPGVAAKHPWLPPLLRACVASVSTPKWRFVVAADADEFARVKAGTAAYRRPRFIGMVRQREAASAAEPP